MGTDIAASTLAYNGTTTILDIASTTSYDVVDQLRVVTNTIAVFTADLFLVLTFQSSVSLTLNRTKKTGLPRSCAMGIRLARHCNTTHSMDNICCTGKLG